MQLLRWQAGNSLANYQYIVVDSERRAVLIDPLDVAEIRQLVSAENLTIAAVLVTHEHQDHAGEAGHLQKLYGVPVYAHERAVAAIAADAIPLQDGAELRISSELVFRCHHTPGHTPGHVVFSAGGMLFSGDCLFHAGCGHCRSTGADLQEHYRSLTERLAALNLDLLLFPGHYYARRNLDFALHVEPENSHARELRKRLHSDADELAHVVTLRQERGYNPFFRLHSRNLRRRLAELTGKELRAAPDFQVFLELRRLRDRW